MALIFLFGFGEEISWGQRILDYPTPEWLRRHNLQEEVNIHNLRIFSASKDHLSEGSIQIGQFITLGRLYSIFWAMYCVLIPLAARLSAPIEARLARMRFPLVPLPLGLLFVYTYVVFKIAESSFLGHHEHFLVEVKESNLALLFLFVAIWNIRQSESVPN